MNDHAPALTQSVFKHFDMEENDQFKTQEYKSGQGTHGITRTGQNKLYAADMMAYIYFYITRGKVPHYVIVAGGAPGTHFVKLITKLPKQTEWHLYDPEPFAEELLKLQANGYKIFTYQQLYNTEACLHWSTHTNVLFLSDIRNTEYTPTVTIVKNLKCQQRTQQTAEQIKQYTEQLEAMAENDMQLQRQMVLTTAAEMSVVKLRLPYAYAGQQHQDYQYLDGKVWFQYNNRSNSTECRLVVVPVNVDHYKESGIAALFVTKHFNITTHEQKCAFINMQLRPQWDTDALQIIESAYATMMQALGEEKKTLDFACCACNPPSRAC